MVAWGPDLKEPPYITPIMAVLMKLNMMSLVSML